MLLGPLSSAVKLYLSLQQWWGEEKKHSPFNMFVREFSEILAVFIVHCHTISFLCPVVCFQFSFFLFPFRCLQRQQFFLGALSVWWVGVGHYCPRVLFPNLKGLFHVVKCMSKSLLMYLLAPQEEEAHTVISEARSSQRKSPSQKM